MLRTLPLLVLVLALAGACTDDEPEAAAPDPGPAEEPEEGSPARGVRVGVVLPPGETDAHERFDEVRDRAGGEVVELRTVVPDSADFVGDVTTLLAVEGYDVVCVFGADAAETVVDVASRHAATTFCAGPSVSTTEARDNVLLVDVGFEELGRVVGAALRALAGDEPAALLSTETSAAAGQLRRGVQAGVGDTPLYEARDGVQEIGAEVDTALGEDVRAIALDAGAGAEDLVERAADVPLLAPAPLLEAEEGALRWEVRWDLVLGSVLEWYLDGQAGEPPDRLGLGDEVFLIETGPLATSPMRNAVEEAMRALGQRGDDAVA